MALTKINISEFLIDENVNIANLIPQFLLNILNGKLTK